MAENANLRIIQLNTNGRPGNSIKLANYLEENASPGTIFVLNDIRCQAASEIVLEGFSTIVANREERGHYAGGSAIIFNKEWASREFPHQEGEGIIIALNPDEEFTIIVATIYVHPNGIISQEFIDKVDQASQHIPTVLVGDFNSAAIEYGSRLDTRSGLHLVESISRTSLTYIENATPTYISASTGNWNVLDLAFGNRLFLEALESLQVDNEAISDHLPLRLNLKARTETRPPLRKKMDWNSFKSHCENSATLLQLDEAINEEAQRLSQGGETSIEIVDEFVKSLTSELVKAKSEATEWGNPTRRKAKFPIGLDTKEEGET